MPQATASSGTGHQQRAPGAFNPATSSTSSIAGQAAIHSQARADQRQPGRIPTLNNNSEPPSPANSSHRWPRSRNASPPRLQASPYISQDSSRFPSLNISTTSPNSQRPSASYINSATQRTNSPLRLQPKPNTSTSDFRLNQRKHANSQGFFEPSLPSAGHMDSNAMDLPQVPVDRNLTASQIAAQAAMQHMNHHRNRSQTMPVDQFGQRRLSNPRQAASPPLLSVTEASGERNNGFGGGSGYGNVGANPQLAYRNGLIGSSAAATAANVVFARSPMQSPNIPGVETQRFIQPEKPVKAEKEKSKVKLFSRPGKLKDLGRDKEKNKEPGSPSKLGLPTQCSRAASSTSLTDPTLSSASSMYSLANSSQTTIRASDNTVTPYLGYDDSSKSGKEKKHHHFLSRQKQKLQGKDEHTLPLSSAHSNSKPVDGAPSLYNFSLPPSPGPHTTSFSKSMSGLDLRHGGRAFREKKREEKSAQNASFAESGLRESESLADFGGPSSLGSVGASASTYSASVYGHEPDFKSYGLKDMNSEDAWPLVKSKMLIAFHGEQNTIRTKIEEFNVLVTTHLKRCIQRKSPNLIVDDLRDLITSGMVGIDANLSRHTDDRLLSHLVEQWMFIFAKLLPYLQGVFLPLDLEFEGRGPLLTPDNAREFWGALPLSSLSNGNNNLTSVPAHYLLNVRRIVLTTFRDVIVLPRFEILQTIFSRLSLESINFPPQPAYSQSPIHPFSTSPPDSLQRPGTSASLDPAFSSFNSQTTTLAGSDSQGTRSRGISNVSFGSDQRDAVYRDANLRPEQRPGLSGLTNNSGSGSQRDMRDTANEDSKNVTDTVGRMLQCMSVLSSVGIIPGDGSEVRAQREAAAGRGVSGGGRTRGYSTGMVEDEGKQEMMDRLCRALKLNWLGRGRTGRNRRGFVGARMRSATTGVPTVG